MTIIAHEPAQSDAGRNPGIEGLLALYRLTPALLYAMDEDGRLLEMSEQCVQMLGYTRSEMLGRSTWELLTPASKEHLQAMYGSTLLATGQLREVECEFVKKSGEIAPFMLSATAERNERGEVTRVLVLLTDANPHTQSERVLREILEGTASHTGGDFFRSLVSHVAQAFQVCYAMITECTDHTLTRVRTLACYKYHNFLEQFEYDLAGGPCAGVIAGNVCHYPRLRDLFPKEDQFSYLGVPIHDSHGAVLGHLVIEDDKPLQPGPYDIDILKLFAARAGAELERKRAEGALHEREQQLQRLNERLIDSNRSLEEMVAARTREIEQRRQVAESLRDMVMILNSERPLAEILDYIVVAATQLLGADKGAIYTLQPDQTLAIQATRGLQAVYARDLAISAEHTFLKQAVTNRQPVVISQPAAPPAPQATRLLEEQAAQEASSRMISAQTLLAVPLIRQDLTGQNGEVSGGIALGYHAQRQFSDEEIGLAMAFGAQAALAIENAHLHERAEMAAVMEERARLARELHDSVTQQLYSLTLLAEGWRRLARSGQLPQVDEALAELGQLGQQALKEMRLLIYELHPPVLEQEGLLGALHQRLAAVERRAGVEARLVAEEMLELPGALEAGLYRIALEALNNALKHAAATAVLVTLHVLDDRLSLVVRDNGAGFEPEHIQRGGLGLVSMRERARQMGGALNVSSTPGGGTTVEVVVPYQRDRL